MKKKMTDIEIIDIILNRLYNTDQPGLHIKTAILKKANITLDQVQYRRIIKTLDGNDLARHTNQVSLISGDDCLSITNNGNQTINTYVSYSSFLKSQEKEKRGQIADKRTKRILAVFSVVGVLSGIVFGTLNYLKTETIE